MKKAFFLMCFVAAVVTALAQRKNETKSPLIGSWKISNQSEINDFQKVSKYKRTYPIEFFTFEPDHSFRHEFYDLKNNLVKTLKGYWKAQGDKVKIHYYDIDFDLTIPFFFIDNDLVLGQNFNHVIFKKDAADDNVAMK